MYSLGRWVLRSLDVVVVVVVVVSMVTVAVTVSADLELIYELAGGGSRGVPILFDKTKKAINSDKCTHSGVISGSMG